MYRFKFNEKVYFSYNSNDNYARQRKKAFNMAAIITNIRIYSYDMCMKRKNKRRCSLKEQNFQNKNQRKKWQIII